MGDQYYAASEAINVAASTALVTLDVTITAANRRFAVNELGVSFNGSTAATPPIVRLVRTTVAAASSPSGLTQAATPLDPAAPASLCTAYAPSTATPGAYTTAPTVGVQVRTFYVPNTGLLVVQFPLGQEPDSPSTPAAAGLGIQVLSTAAATVSSYIVWSE